MSESLTPDVVTALSSAERDEFVHWRSLSVLMVFALLRTRCATAGTERLVGDYPSDFVVLATQRLPMSATLHDDGRLSSLSDDRLVITDNRARHTSSSVVANPVGVCVPTELVDIELPPRAQTFAPMVSNTPLARATASFIRRFAYDACVDAVDVGIEAELAVADLVKSVIREQLTDPCSAREPVHVIGDLTRRLIDRNYRDSSFDVTAIARELHVSKRHLYRQLAQLEIAPAELISERRLEHALHLLGAQATMTIEQIATASGFASVATMRNRFRTRLGVTPDRFRQNPQSTMIGRRSRGEA